MLYLFAFIIALVVSGLACAVIAGFVNERTVEEYDRRHGYLKE